MSELRELTEAELDIVGGGLGFQKPHPTGVIKLVEEVIVDILRLLEPKQPMRSMY